jgi:hypothetical protein
MCALLLAPTTLKASRPRLQNGHEAVLICLMFDREQVGDLLPYYTFAFLYASS